MNLRGNKYGVDTYTLTKGSGMLDIVISAFDDKVKFHLFNCINKISIACS